MLEFVLPGLWAVAGLLAAPFLNRLIVALPGARETAVSPSVARLQAGLLWMITPPLFAAVAWAFGVSLRTPLATFYVLLFLVIAAIDLKHRVVLNRVVYPAILLSPLAALLWGLPLERIVFGGAIEFGFFLISALATRGRGIGAGDVKLAVCLGFLAGFPRVVLALVLTIGMAGIAALLMSIRNRGVRGHMAYAPFMVAGTLLAILLR